MSEGSADVTIGKATTASKKFDKSHPVNAETEYGKIEGFVHTADDGTKSNVFLGIPFAQPPVGELRFENPNFSEDCLYVNVIAPAEPSSDPKGYPVLVYIHGGGFGFGDVIKCGFDKITKNYAKRGLVTVTVPYRVGLYGFMSLGTKEDPGNLGLWDQVAALKFIKNNIKHLGGNDENITIWGQSAGSASVDLMALSPHSRDLFHKVIQASGAALDEWASTAPVIKVTKQLAKFMGCESEDAK
uniref:Carboxylesterase type B domain-containing protein n=1 Tax=Panagrolaimus sp. ES5 TaxID=591445 RepID=A0AC34GRG4_9BILA